MALILSLETSASTCSVALHREGVLVASKKIEEPQAHASKLAILIEALLSESSVAMKELQAVAVSSGPGSYTGLRIGASTAKGLCFALNVPLIAIPTLDILFRNQLHKDTWPGNLLFCPMIDAKRMEVYTQVYARDGSIIQTVSAVEVDENSFSELLERQPVLFFGDGAEKCSNVIKHKNAMFDISTKVDAGAMGEPAFENFRHKAFTDIVQFTPFYLKEFVAKTAARLF